MSEITKQYRTKKYICLGLSLLVTVLPVLVYLIKGFIEAETVQKLSLGMFAIASVALVAINILLKMHLRSPIWLLVLGIYIALKNILPLLIMVAIGTILDEFLFTPLYKSYKAKTQINKEIDKRS